MVWSQKKLIGSLLEPEKNNLSQSVYKIQWVRKVLFLAECQISCTFEQGQKFSNHTVEECQKT